MFDDLSHIDAARDNALTALKQVLKETPADHWYDVIRRADSVDHVDLIHWMVSQPRCDRSVALHALLNSDLLGVLNAGGTTDDCGPVVHTILENVAKGRYGDHVVDCKPDLRYMARLVRQALDKAAETADHALLNDLIGRIAKGGEVVLAGFYTQPLQFAFPPAFMKEARLRIAAEWSPDDMTATRALVESGALRLDDLITHTAAAAEAPKAYETAFTNPACLKMILDWSTA